MGKGKERYDWDAIWREYTTGQFTDSELSRRFGCSRAAIIKRRKKEGWIRDNTQQVRQLANAKLIVEDAQVTHVTEPEVTTCHMDRKDHDRHQEKSEIELAAETRVVVLRMHRKDISKLRDLETKLIKELDNEPTKLYMCNFKGDILSEEVGIPVTEKSQALNNLASVQHKRIALERTAFNLNDLDDKDDGLPTVIVHDPGAEEEN